MPQPRAVLCTALVLSLAALASAQECPSKWVPRQGVCMWPKQQAYKHISVNGSALGPGAACCAACAADSKCVSWLVYTAKHDAFDAHTCTLNNAEVRGQAPNAPLCISGVRPPHTWPPSPAPKPAPKGAKNVLFFAVDDLRPEINAFGGAGAVPGTHVPKMHTPAFDALAAESLVLTKNYVQQAVCSPTRTSLLTGRRPDRTRVYDLYSNFRFVAANYTTLPEFFLHNGYKTQGMGKIFHPGHASANDDTCCSWSNGSAYFHAPDAKYWTGTGTNTIGTGGSSWFSVPAASEAMHPLPDNQTANHAVEALGILEREALQGDSRPFFLAVGYHKPHLPFVASERFFDLYPPSVVKMPPNPQPPAGMPPVAWASYGELRAYSDQAKLNASGQPGTVLPKEDVLALRRGYYASVSQTDFLLGKVMEALKGSSFAKNTVVSIWGDHGWQLGEHGEWCKHTNFEFAARAPMMIHVPGLTDHGIVSSHYSEHVDLFPTLVEAATGMPMPKCPPGDASFGVALCTEGSSLVPMMKEPATPVKLAAFSQYPRGYQSQPDGGVAAAVEDLLEGTPTTSQCIMEGGKGCTMGYTMVTRVGGHEYRYTEWCDFNTPGFKFKVNWARNVGTELYNHTADPGENYNLNATSTSTHELSAYLSRMLHKGPDTARVE